MKWTEVWNKPFRYDRYCYIWSGYIWSGNNVMTFAIDMDRDINSSFIVNFIQDMVDVLNGNEIKNKYEKLEIKDDCDLYYDGIIIGSFRGWGYLTGSGALGLSEKEAVTVQNEMIEFVLNGLVKK